MIMSKSNSRSTFERKEADMRIYDYIEDSPVELADLDGSS
jgi:hypothetical protein